MKKTFIVPLALAGVVFLASAFTARQEDPNYKNLKILPKDITHEQLDSVMHHFTGSLNVKCNFCHVRNEEKKEWDWASDDNKHKLVARQMMEMTNSLNDKYFPYSGKAKDLKTVLTVTCYTCHHGATEPETKVPRRERPQARPAADSVKQAMGR